MKSGLIEEMYFRNWAIVFTDAFVMPHLFNRSTNKKILFTEPERRVITELAV